MSQSGNLFLAWVGRTFTSLTDSVRSHIPQMSYLPLIHLSQVLDTSGERGVVRFSEEAPFNGAPTVTLSRSARIKGVSVRFLETPPALHWTH